MNARFCGAEIRRPARRDRPFGEAGIADAKALHRIDEAVVLAEGPAGFVLDATAISCATHRFARAIVGRRQIPPTSSLRFVKP
jgi:hypothetical protein